MKKILYAILFFLTGFLCLSSSAAVVEYDIEAITDETTIEEDFEKLGLKYSDYKLNASSKGKVVKAYQEHQNEEQFVVAVAESRQDSSLITSYIYVYNALFNTNNYVKNIQMRISFNNGVPVEYRYEDSVKTLDLVLEDKSVDLMKFKIQKFKSDVVQRKYTITINKGPEDPFEATYKTTILESEKIVCDSFNFNSYLYITADEVVPVILKQNKTMFPGYMGKGLQQLMGMNPYEYVVVYFYNFSSDKQIDKIESATMKWEQHMERNKYTYPVEIPPIFMGPLYAWTDWSLHFGNLVTDTEAYNHESKKEVLTPKIKEYKFLGQPLRMNAFCTPASDRLKELGNYGDTLSEADKKRFSNYDHSIMFTAGQWTDTRSSGWGSSGSGTMTTLMVEQASLVSLSYTAKGVRYNAYVGDPDGPDDPKNPYNPIDPSKPKQPNKNLWELFREWFLNNMPVSIIVCVVAVFFGPGLISTLISKIIDLIAKILTGGTGGKK